MGMRLLVVLFVCLLSAGAQSASLELQVVNESGIALNSTLRVGSVVSQDSEGRFEIPSTNARSVTLQIEAQGYFPSIQTIRVEDWVGRSIPPISLVEKTPDRRLLVFAGDVMAGRRYLDPLPGDRPYLVRSNQLNGALGLLQHVKPYLSIADMASINLETQLLRPPLPDALPKSVTFYSDPSLLVALAESGVDYAALGNNHLYDYGLDGLKQTLSRLEASPLAYSGAGVDDDSARVPTQVDGFSYLSYVGWQGSGAANQVAQPDKGGAAYGSEENIRADLAKVKTPAVVNYHGGLEYKDVPTLLEQTRLRAAVEAGADVVVAHHPHILQGLELYRNRLIAYSLGNFLFDQYIYSTQASMLLFVWMDGESFHRAEIVPLYINGYVPTPATGDLRYDILQRVRHLSRDGSLRFEPSGMHAAVYAGEDLRTEQSVEIDGSTGIYNLTTHDPTQKIAQVHAENARVRLGVDLIKRGSFDHWGEFGTQPLVWLKPEGSKLVDQRQTLSGTGRLGLRTFERHFTPSAPSSVSLSVQTKCEATVTAILQRRDMVQSRVEALRSGEEIEIAVFELPQNIDRKLMADFALPRRATKGIRLLVDVEQPKDCEIAVDDITLIEWRTAWTDSGARLPDVQATHVQLRPANR